MTELVIMMWVFWVFSRAEEDEDEAKLNSVYNRPYDD